MLRYLNFKIEKSEARAAYLPSLPSIPIPTSAYCIIPTSFPPSPIQAVTFFVYFLIHSATLAFYVGEHLQQTTDGAFVAIVMKSSSCLSRAVPKLIPSITNMLLNVDDASNVFNRSYNFASSVTSLIK